MGNKCHPYHPASENDDKGKLPASADEALLDEFFPIIASISLRLTKNSDPPNNIGKLSIKEGKSNE